MISVTSSFSKSFVLKRFPSTLKRKAGSGLMSVFEKFRLWRISVDGRSNRRNKAAFSNFFGVMLTLP